jgi:pimeloyl-ACP methyl ester carboxylesterase
MTRRRAISSPGAGRLAGRDGRELAYLEMGDGRPLVLLHGFAATGRQWLDHGPAAALAAAGYRVILPDLRGHGDSARPERARRDSARPDRARPHDPACYPPDVLADDGLALIDELGVDDFDLAGYSLGGRTVARLLARGARPGRAVIGGQGFEAVVHTEGRGGRLRRILTSFGTFAPGSPEQAMENWITSSGGDPAALVRILDTFVGTPPEVLASIDVPTLVLTGAGDGHNDTARALAEALPHGRYMMVPGDHLTAVGTPEFETAMLSFLTGPEPDLAAG